MNRIEKPFTNEIGQTINVGDEVLVVTMSTSCLGVRQGTYLGLKPSNRVQVQVPRHTYKYFHKITGELVEYSDLYRDFSTWEERSKFIKEHLESREVVSYYTSTLNLNKIYALR